MLQFSINRDQRQKAKFHENSIKTLREQTILNFTRLYSGFLIYILNSLGVGFKTSYYQSMTVKYLW